MESQHTFFEMVILISIFEPNHIVGPVIDLFLIILLELTNKSSYKN